MSELAVGLTPVQQRTLDDLRRDGEADPRLDEQLAADLRSQADDALDQLGSRLDDVDLFVTKHTIASVLACETNHLAPDDFTWTPARARGKVSHRAIQLLLNWRGEPTPADLVDEAIARLADEERGIGEWIAALGPADEADLRGRAVERVTQFVECFPPLSRTWHPMTEAAVQWPADGPILLRARVDLVIGRPAGLESRKVLIDFKSGRVVDRHREDLRFYALVETLAREVPPRSVASFSLETGEAMVDQVSESMLWSSLRRTLDAIDRMIELTVEGRPPAPPPSAGCFRCRELN
jgi:PD-(D/E)XK nuclease superfamily